MNIRRYDRCPIDPLKLRCVNQVEHFWLCEPAICPGQIVHYLNACYQPTAVVVAVEDLPDGDLLIRQGELGFPECGSYVSCGDASCTQCSLYYRAEPCAGSTCPVPVFVPIEVVTECGLVGRNQIGCCSVVRPGGPIYTLAQALATPGAEFDPLGPTPGDCCDCVVSCTRTRGVQGFDCRTGAAFTLPTCCCSREFTITISFSFTRTFRDTSSGITVTWVGNASATIHFVNGSPAVLPAPTWTMIQTTIGDGPTRTDVYADMPFPIWQCGTQAFLVPDYGGGDMAHCFADAPIYDPSFARFEVLAAVLTQSCTAASSRNHTRYYIPEQVEPRIEWVSQGSWTISAQGMCGGGCENIAGSTNAILAGARNIVPVRTDLLVVSGALPDGSGAAALFMRGG